MKGIRGALSSARSQNHDSLRDIIRLTSAQRSLLSVPRTDTGAAISLFRRRRWTSLITLYSRFSSSLGGMRACVESMTSTAYSQSCIERRTVRADGLLAGGREENVSQPLRGRRDVLNILFAEVWNHTPVSIVCSDDHNHPYEALLPAFVVSGQICCLRRVSTKTLMIVEQRTFATDS